MSDTIYWQQLKTGDKAALEKIYRLHFNDMVFYGKRLCQDEDLIRDCIQDLFIYLWKQRERISETSNIRGYLLLSLRRSIIKAIQKKAALVSDDDSDAFMLQASQPFEQMIINNEEADEKLTQLNNSLAKLSERQQEIIYLKFKVGMDNQQIAEALNINYQSVRNLLSRTLKTLRDTFVWLFFYINF